MILADAEEKAHGGPVLVWSARPNDESEPNAAEGAADAVHPVAEAPQVTDLDAPSIRAPAHRKAVFPVVAVAISVLALGSVFLLASEGKRPAETALSFAPSTTAEILASAGVEPEPQPPAKTATVLPSQGAPDAAAANASPAAAASAEIVPELPSADAPRTAPAAASTDPAIPGDASPQIPKGLGATPGANLSVLASTTPPTEQPGSAVLNSALLARGDALFVTGDFSSARMFYERAANAGHGLAALQLGETYDPAFLARIRFTGAQANAAMAAYWYQRARELGIPEADILLAAMEAEAPRRSP
jgi:hypothetical protein